jgi:hypothetical protein
MKDEDKSDRATYEDLARVVAEYSYAKTKENDALRMVESKKSELKSFQGDLDRASDEVMRRKQAVAKIIEKLER